MAETFTLLTKARLDGQNPPVGTSFPGPSVVLPDQIAISPQAREAAARTGLAFLCRMPDGSQKLMQVAAGQGGPGNEFVITPA